MAESNSAIKDLPLDDSEIRAWSNLFHDKVSALKETIGTDAVNTFAIKIAIENEKYLREQDPDSNLLKLLDTYRYLKNQGLLT